ncbi:hypothetical protein LZ32DRAFT_648322 [Colletotrichum eremochloae]|nr:hypothetical protein LZ32DRAFT_648322 [Colletotrichum eremochloae]
MPNRERGRDIKKVVRRLCVGSLGLWWEQCRGEQEAVHHQCRRQVWQPRLVILPAHHVPVFVVVLLLLLQQFGNRGVCSGGDGRRLARPDGALLRLLLARFRGHPLNPHWLARTVRIYDMMKLIPIGSSQEQQLPHPSQPLDRKWERGTKCTHSFLRRPLMIDPSLSVRVRAFQKATFPPEPLLRTLPTASSTGSDPRLGNPAVWFDVRALPFTNTIVLPVPYHHLRSRWFENQLYRGDGASRCLVSYQGRALALPLVLASKHEAVSCSSIPGDASAPVL